ncbi:uncharacterized protein LOC105836010 isoform X2 [Monomorium pharaonis]|uniref:uncharacterized protein LOC105836010 isoform X2 n=1 Tax=Monomorium pharaonis TaxID=307658 RepID=UPI001745FBD0|nr:uncharacterized protein LOC105836010 isoform X2 [Monomorium pharaonis]
MKKGWIFHATDFQTLMYPCFMICRILGIFPYKINNSIFVISKLYYILSTVLISVLCMLELENFYHLNVFTKAEFEVITLSLENNCYIILIISIIIITFVLSSSRMRLLQTIMDISVKISPQSYQELSKLIHAKDIFGFLFVTIIIFIYIHKYGFETLQLIFGIYSVLLVFQINMLYINCVCILKTCFKEIENSLLYIKKLVVNDKLYAPKTIYYKQKNPFLIIKLKTMKEQHLMISNTVKKLNVIFSPQLLLTITITFGATIFGLYFHLVQWHNGFVINKDGYFIYLTFIVHHVTKMALLMWACETGKNQARNIGTTIHDVLNNTKNKQIKNELQLFSLQILHLDNTFSAKGFNVDAAFFARMIGTITTYMFILLQFFIISHSCDEKSKINITQMK